MSDIVDQVLGTKSRFPKHVQLILDIGVLLLSSNVSIIFLRSQYLLVGRVRARLGFEGQIVLWKLRVHRVQVIVVIGAEVTSSMVPPLVGRRESSLLDLREAISVLHDWLELVHLECVLSGGIIEE